MTRPYPVFDFGDLSDAERTAQRNCWLSWVCGSTDTLEEEVNRAAYFDSKSPRVTRIQADDALRAAAKLERMATDLRAIAARRITPLEIVENAA